MWIYFSVNEWEEGEAGEAAGELDGEATGEVAVEAAGEVAGEETQSETDQNISIDSMGKDQGKNIIEYWFICYFQLYNWKTKAYTRIFGIIYILIEHACLYF